jgi:hypothetical protein
MSPLPLPNCAWISFVSRQPMDVRVFGVLKRKQSKLYDEAMRECPGRAWTKASAVRTIVEAWGEIDANVVKSAWRGACGEAEGV